MKNAKPVIIFLIVALMIILAITFTASFFSNATAVTSNDTYPITSAANTSGVSYTLAQVSKHSSISDCWTIVGSGVYNVTSWINQHPGGPEAILSTCGKDATVAFEAQHGGQKRPENELASFYIGTYSK